MDDKKIEIVASFTDTVPGKMIRLRAAMKFWNRYPGDTYSHISLSRDSKLGHMLSFARKEINNPFDSGLVMEDIHSGMFALKPDISKIAVMELKVSPEQYQKISLIMDYFWAHKEQYHFNFPGLASMLFCGKGVEIPNHYFCSQWVATVLKDSGIDLFDGKNPKDVRPFDFYGRLQDHIIYEGLTTGYPEYSENSKNGTAFENKIIESTSSARVLRKSIGVPSKVWR